MPRLTPTLCASPDDIGDRLAQRIVREVSAAAGRGARYVLGCPAGRTPLPVYRALTRRDFTADRIDVVMMDEFVVGIGDRLVARDAHYSCLGFAERHILPALPGARLHHPDPADPARYDRTIAALGGIDLFLLASGASDGHVAFNPPGSAIDSESRIVRLADETRRDNLATFPDFDSIEDTPTHGVSIGLGTIARHSRSVAMILHGAGKGETLRRILPGAFEPTWPATIVHVCRDASLLVDHAALAAAR